MLKNLLLLSAFSAFAVVVIIGFNVYHNFTLSSLPSITKKRVVAIPATFDKATIEELKKRKPITVDLFEKTQVVSEDAQGLSTTPTPTNAATQIASGSAI
jgi:hypothetical protein